MTYDSIGGMAVAAIITIIALLMVWQAGFSAAGKQKKKYREYHAGDNMIRHCFEDGDIYMILYLKGSTRTPIVIPKNTILEPDHQCWSWNNDELMGEWRKSLLKTEPVAIGMPETTRFEIETIVDTVIKFKTHPFLEIG